jgi:hypothetical protein
MSLLKKWLGDESKIEQLETELRLANKKIEQIQRAVEIHQAAITICDQNIRIIEVLVSKG